MKKILMTRLSVCSLGVSCNEMIDTPMLLVVSYAAPFPCTVYCLPRLARAPLEIW